MFDRYDRLPCDTYLIGEFLLSHLAEGPQFSNLIVYGGQLERLSVSHDLSGRFRNIGDNQHPEEDAQKMKTYHPAVYSKMADSRVNPHHAENV